MRKRAEVSMGLSAPNIPVSLGVRAHDERLPGMNRWVPRSYLERALQGVDDGLDAQALMDEAADQGSLVYPAIGAGLGALLARLGMPAAGASGLGLGAAAGAGVGSIAHALGAPSRRGKMHEAVKGAVGEKQRLGDTAREPAPLITSGSGVEQ